MGVQSTIDSVMNFMSSPTVTYANNLFTSEGSIMTAINTFIIEPTVFVSSSIKNDDPDIMHRAITEQIDIFCGFYSMAFKILNELAGTKADVYLKKMKTSSHDYNLNVGKGIQAVMKYNSESYNQLFQKHYNGNESGVMKFNNSKTLSGCFESMSTRINDEGTSTWGSSTHNKTKDFNDSLGYGVYTRFFELSTKRMFRFTKTEKDANGNDIDKHTDEERTVVLPICIRAHIVFFDTEELHNVFDIKGNHNTFTQRYWKWRSGGISFKEFILCTDLINEYRKKKLNNKNTILDILNGKTYNATLTAIRSDGIRGFEKYFNMYLLSGTDIEKLEKELRGSMNKQGFAQEILTKLQAMELMVIDTEYNTGQMYLHTMPTPATFPLNKLGKRKENSDLGDLLKSLYANKPPMF